MAAPSTLPMSALSSPSVGVACPPRRLREAAKAFVQGTSELASQLVARRFADEFSRAFSLLQRPEAQRASLATFLLDKDPREDVALLTNPDFLRHASSITFANSEISVGGAHAGLFESDLTFDYMLIPCKITGSLSYGSVGRRLYGTAASCTADSHVVVHSVAVGRFVRDEATGEMLIAVHSFRDEEGNERVSILRTSFESATRRTSLSAIFNPDEFDDPNKGPVYAMRRASSGTHVRFCPMCHSSPHSGCKCALPFRAPTGPDDLACVAENTMHAMGDWVGHSSNVVHCPLFVKYAAADVMTHLSAKVPLPAVPVALHQGILHSRLALAHPARSIVPSLYDAIIRPSAPDRALIPTGHPVVFDPSQPGPGDAANDDEECTSASDSVVLETGTVNSALLSFLTRGQSRVPAPGDDAVRALPRTAPASASASAFPPLHALPPAPPAPAIMPPPIFGSAVNSSSTTVPAPFDPPPPAPPAVDPFADAFPAALAGGVPGDELWGIGGVNDLAGVNDMAGVDVNDIAGVGDDIAGVDNAGLMMDALFTAQDGPTVSPGLPIARDIQQPGGMMLDVSALAAMAAQSALAAGAAPALPAPETPGARSSSSGAASMSSSTVAEALGTGMAAAAGLPPTSPASPATPASPPADEAGLDATARQELRKVKNRAAATRSNARRKERNLALRRDLAFVRERVTVLRRKEEILQEENRMLRARSAALS